MAPRATTIDTSGNLRIHIARRAASDLCGLNRETGTTTWGLLTAAQVAIGVSRCREGTIPILSLLASPPNYAREFQMNLEVSQGREPLDSTAQLE